MPIKICKWISERESDSIPYLEQENLVASVFVVNLTDTSIKSVRLKSAFK